MKTKTPLSLIVATTTLFAAASAQAFFDPHIGRFASRDSIQEAGGANLYVFVANDSVKLRRPVWAVEESERTFVEGRMRRHADLTGAEERVWRKGS
jgi:hypothetical protein